jgi:hypothetical protein
VLPTKLGWFTLDYSDFTSFWALSRVIFRTLLGVFFVSWLLNKLSGSVVLQ